MVWGVVLHVLLCFGALGDYCLLWLQYQSNWLWFPVIGQDFQNGCSNSRNILVSWVSTSWPDLEDWVWKINKPQSSLILRNPERKCIGEGEFISPKEIPPPPQPLSCTHAMLGLGMNTSDSEAFTLATSRLVSETALKAKPKWLIHEDLYRYRAM